MIFLRLIDKIGNDAVSSLSYYRKSLYWNYRCVEFMTLVFIFTLKMPFLALFTIRNMIYTWLYEFFDDDAILILIEALCRASGLLILYLFFLLTLRAAYICLMLLDKFLKLFSNLNLLFDILLKDLFFLLYKGHFIFEISLVYYAEHTTFLYLSKP